MIDVRPLLDRTGAARIALIPAPVLDALNAGLIETVNLNEVLANPLSDVARGCAAQGVMLSDLPLRTRARS